MYVFFATQLLAHLFQQIDDAQPLLVGHQQGLADTISKKGIVVYTTSQLRISQQLGVEEQCPALGVYLLALVDLAAYLPWCDAHQGMAVQVVLQLAVGQVLQFLVADEQGIDIIVIERVSAVLQLVVVYDRDERVQHWSPDVPGIVVDTVNA